jgi:hypothetical protein
VPFVTESGRFFLTTKPLESEPGLADFTGGFTFDFLLEEEDKKSSSSFIEMACETQELIEDWISITCKASLIQRQPFEGHLEVRQ